jgi:hypothetical protein
VALLAETEGQVLTSLPGVASIRAAAFAAHSLPIERFPDAETSLLSNRFGASSLSVSHPAPSETNLSTGVGRTPRCTDGNRLGALSELAFVCRTRRATARPRDGPDPSPRRARTSCLPPGIPTTSNPTTLR